MRYQLIILSILAALFVRGTAALADGISLGGSLTVDLQVGLDSPNTLESTALLQLRLSGPLGDYGAIVAKLEVGEGSVDLLRLREAFVDLYLDNWDLRLGKQRIAWGATDWVNPTDNLNPVDYTRPFEEDNRLEILAVKADRYFARWQSELVWVPVFLPAKQPLPGDRWSPPFAPPVLPPGLTELALAPRTFPPGPWPTRSLASIER